MIENPLTLGKPTRNGFIESFNGKLRDEFLNETVFSSLAEARTLLQGWRRDYNEERPHSRIGQRVPILLRNPGGASSPPPAKEAENFGFR